MLAAGSFVLLAALATRSAAAAHTAPAGEGGGSGGSGGGGDGGGGGEVRLAAPLLRGVALSLLLSFGVLEGLLLLLLSASHGIAARAHGAAAAPRASPPLLRLVN